MFPALRHIRNPFRALGLVSLVATLAACMPGGPTTTGPQVRGEAIQVAMLLPVGSSQGGDSVVSRGLENAARLAAAENPGANIQITVYDTAGQASQAAALAQQAVAAGADVIVGPLRSDAAAAVGVAVANSNVMVLSFSNNTEIAGGNVFVLGHTFANTADRVVSYAAAQGRNRIVVSHANNLAGLVARDAVTAAAERSSASVVGIVPYEFSQTGVVNAAPQVARLVRETNANALMLTSNSAGALPFFAQLLPENGLDIQAVRLMGTTRWDTPSQTAELAGLQGSWFALPDPSANADFNARYSAQYGDTPHILAPLGYDAILAVAETATNTGRLGAGDFTASSGFDGANGVFRFLGDGTNRRAMAIAQITNNQVVVIDPAPRRLGGFGS